MQALYTTFVVAAPALHAGQAKRSTFPVSHREQQQSLLLVYGHRHNLPLAQVEHVFAVEASPEGPSASTHTLTPNLTDFTLVSLGLAVLFWIGNYVVPDFIFNKLFGSDDGDKNDSEKQKFLDGLVGGIDKTSSGVASSSGVLTSSEEEGTVSATGFGKRVSKVRKERR